MNIPYLGVVFFMVFAKITGSVLILFGIYIGLVHFELFSNVMFGINLVSVGIVIFIAHELVALFSNISSGGNKIIGIGVPLLFIIVAGSNFIINYMPEMIALNLKLIIAVIMCAEGLYRLH